MIESAAYIKSFIEKMCDVILLHIQFTHIIYVKQTLYFRQQKKNRIIMIISKNRLNFSYCREGLDDQKHFIQIKPF